MATPSTDDGTKSVRVSPEVHARLQNIVDTTGCKTLSEAIALLLTPQVVRIAVSPEQRERWEEAAKLNGVPLGQFVSTRVEAAIEYGADPGALRRIHDLVHAMARRAGVIEQHPRPRPGDGQVITVRQDNNTT